MTTAPNLPGGADRSEMIEDYVAQIGRLLQEMDPGRRSLVLTDVRGRAESAVAALGHDASEIEMREILDEIGAPGVIAREAWGPREDRLSAIAAGPSLEWPDEPAPRIPMTGAWVPILSAVLIFLGGMFALFLLPVLALVVAIVLVSISPLWERSRKLIGVIVPAIGLGAFLPLFSVAAGGLGGEPNGLLLGVALVLLLTGIAALGWFTWTGLRSARAHREAYLAGGLP